MITYSSIAKNYVLQAVGLVSTFFFQLLIVNFLSKSEYGTFSVIWSSLLLVSVMTVMGMDRFLIVKSSGMPEKRRFQNYTIALSIVTGFSLIGAACLGIYYYLLGCSLAALCFALIIYFFHSVTKINEGNLIASGRFSTVNLYVSACRPVLFLVAVLSIQFCTNTINVKLILLMQSVVLLLVFIVTVPRGVWRANPIRIDYLSRRNAKWVFDSSHFFFIGASIVIIQNADILIANHFLGSEGVASYSFSSRIVTYTSVGLGLFATIISPVIATKGINQQTVNQTNAKFALLSIGSSIVAWVFAVYVIGSFFPKYSDSTWIIETLLVGVLVKGFFGPVEVYLTMQGRSNVASKVMLKAAAFNIGLNFLLVPLFGIIGSVITSIFTVLVWNLMMYRYLRDNLRINTCLLGVFGGSDE